MKVVMTHWVVAIRVFGIVLMTFAMSAVAADATVSKTAPGNEWDPKWFHYDRPDEPIVVIETPSAAQVD